METTTRCNYDYIFYFIRFLEFHEWINIDLDIFKRILYQAKKSMCKNIFWLMG